MDLAWMAKPPGLTMLYGEVIPPVGGDTCVTSLAQAWRALSPGMQTLPRDKIAVHRGKGVFEIDAMSRRLALRADARGIAAIEAERPMVCLHPRTGEPYLFVSSVIQRITSLSGGRAACSRRTGCTRGEAGVQLPCALGAGHADDLGQTGRPAAITERVTPLLEA